MTDQPTQPDNGQIITVALSEFSALRKEISDRSSAQMTIVNVNLTAIAAIATLVLSNKTSVLALLVFPIVSPCFGMIFFDHAANIDRIGRYLQYDLRRVIVDATGDDALLTYEEKVRNYERTFLPRGLSLGLPLLVVFAGVPVASLARTVPTLHAGWAWGLWVAGLLVVSVFLLHWYGFVRRPFRPDVG